MFHLNIFKGKLTLKMMLSFTLKCRSVLFIPLQIHNSLNAKQELVFFKFKFPTNIYCHIYTLFPNELITKFLEELLSGLKELL